MFYAQDVRCIVILHGVKEMNFRESAFMYDVMFCRGFCSPRTADDEDSCTYRPCEEI